MIFSISCGEIGAVYAAKAAKARSGTPLDNAVAGSFFKTLKREMAEGRSYGTRDEAKQDIFERIELY